MNIELDSNDLEVLKKDSFLQITSEEDDNLDFYIELNTDLSFKYMESKSEGFDIEDIKRATLESPLEWKYGKGKLCPRCYLPLTYHYKFCPECGQALDWSQKND